MKKPSTRKPTKKKSTERFTITEVKGKRGSSWLVTGYKKTGERFRQKFKTHAEAEKEKHALDLEALGEKKQNITDLTKAKIEDAKAALAALGGQASLVDAVYYYRTNYKKVSTKPLKDAISDFIDDRETTTKKSGRTRSERTIYELKNRLKAFETFMIDQAVKTEVGNSKASKQGREELAEALEPKQVDQITSADIEAFLETKGASWNNYRSKLFGFFKWCVKEHLCAANPVDGVERRSNETSIEYLSVAETSSLLNAARDESDGEFLAYVAIALFAGLRPDSELKKLTWKNVGLKSKRMRVPAGKTGIARAITMPDNLIEWLEVCDRTKPILPAGSFQRKFAKVKRAAGFKGGVRDTKEQRNIDDAEGMKSWIPDYTRHTFITYHVAKHGDKFKTATISGNSPEMIEQHYDGLVVDADAVETFWTITPKTLEEDNLVDIKSA